MILQPILFPQECICKETDLYYRGPSTQFGSTYHLGPNQSVSFDTYFNIFSIDKWKKYTSIENLSLTLKIQGECQIEVFEAQLTNKEKSIRKISSASKDYSSNFITIDFPDIESIHGVCYFTITAGKNSCTIIDGAYETYIQENTLNRVKLGIGICTFKREQFILKNLKAIQDYHLDNPNSPLYNNLEVYVADNGQTLNKYNYTHQNVRIYPNINAGGSGGFTRCMIEVIKKNEEINLTHLILMDDDIVLDPAVLTRTYHFLQVIKNEYSDRIIGGAMFKIEKRFEQSEAGAFWSGKITEQLYFGHQFYDLKEFNAVIKNEDFAKINYNAWFFCCMPMQYINKNNLPLPFFIHFDDIEYGLRNNPNPILLNGICVWHSTENKLIPWMHYYDIRNKIISGLLLFSNSHNQKKLFLRLILQRFIFCIIQYRYVEWNISVKAIRDICKKGPSCLYEKNPIDLHSEITKINYSSYSLDKSEQILELSSEERRMNTLYYSQWNTRQKLSIIKAFLNLFIPSKTRKAFFIKDTSLFSHHFWRRKKIFVYNEKNENGYFLEKSLKQTAKSFFEMLSLSFNVLTNYKSIEAQFNKEKSKLRSIDFWTKYLQLDK